jgi:hypothetical protein
MARNALSFQGSKQSRCETLFCSLGAKTQEDTEMMNAMVCHIGDGELRIVQDGKTLTAKKNYAWTCNKGTKEHVVNDSNAVAIMRITDLKV